MHWPPFYSSSEYTAFEMSVAGRFSFRVYQKMEIAPQIVRLFVARAKAARRTSKSGKQLQNTCRVWLGGCADYIAKFCYMLLNFLK